MFPCYMTPHLDWTNDRNGEAATVATTAVLLGEDRHFPIISAITVTATATATATPDNHKYVFDVLVPQEAKNMAGPRQLVAWWWWWWPS